MSGGTGWGEGWGEGWGGGDGGGSGGGSGAGVAEDPTPAEVPKDLTAQALGRVILQFRESSKMLRMLSIAPTLCQDVETVLTAIPQLDDPDTATGVNLDVTGDLVGQARAIPGEDAPADPLYRLMIKARVGRNSSHATGEDMIAALGVLLNNPPIFYIDWGDMAVGYAIGRTLTPDEVSILSGLDLLARSMGVLINPRETFDPTDYFGFDEDPNSHGFADDSSGTPVGGGVFAIEF